MAATEQEHPLIRHQEIGENFQGIYYLESIYHKLTQHGKDYTEVMLRDKSGARPAKVWAKVKGLERGDFVFVAGNVEEYLEAPSIILKNIEKEDPPADLDNYMPVYEDSAAMSEKFDDLRDLLKEFCKSIKDDTADMLVDEVFRSSSFFTRFISAPGNDKPYYGRRGGLLASTVRVTDLAWESAERNGFDAAEGAILIAAGLIRQIGATDAYEFVDCVPATTERGILLGVNNLTMTRLANSMRRMMEHAKKQKKEANQEILMRILHCVGSCQEVVKPMTNEALALAAACRSDAEIVHAKDFIMNDQNDDVFTAWDAATRRRYYRG